MLVMKLHRFFYLNTHWSSMYRKQINNIGRDVSVKWRLYFNRYGLSYSVWLIFHWWHWLSSSYERQSYSYDSLYSVNSSVLRFGRGGEGLVDAHLFATSLACFLDIRLEFVLRLAITTPAWQTRALLELGSMEFTQFLKSWLLLNPVEPPKPQHCVMWWMRGDVLWRSWKEVLESSFLAGL